jgi:O-antigen/teichoic acid export membrane protein
VIASYRAPAPILEPPVPKVRESTFRPAVLLMAGRALASIATLLIPVTLVRVFDQSEYGTYKQLFLVFTTLYSVALVGLSDSLYYFVPRDPAKGGRYVANALVGLSFAGLVCLAGLHEARFLVAGWMKNQALSEHLDSIGVFLLFTLVATVLEIALIARKRYSRASAAYVVSDVVRALCFVLPMLFLPSLHMLMLWAMVFSALRLVVALALLKKEFGQDLRIDRALLPAQLAYAVPFALYVLVEILQATFHQYAVSWTFDAATFAIYSVGCFQVPFVDFLATPASSVMMVRMSEEMREGRSKEALSIWLDITRKLALIFFPMVALLMAASREVITFLFTDAYAASAPIFALWALTIALSVLQTDGVMRVHAQIRFLFLVNVARLALIVIFIQPLMAVFGLRGPVLVTLLAMVLAKGLHLFRMRRVMRLKVRELLPWPSLGAILGVSVMAMAPVLLVRDLVVGPRLLVLLMEGASFSLTYLLLLFAAGIINVEERAGIRRWLRVSVLGSPSPTGAR